MARPARAVIAPPIRSDGLEPHRGHQDRRQDGAREDAGHDQGVQGSERAAEHVRAEQPLERRHDQDVDDDHRGALDQQDDQRDARLARDGERGHGEPAQHRRDGEHEPCLGPSREPVSDPRRRDAADPDRRIEEGNALDLHPQPLRRGECVQDRLHPVQDVGRHLGDDERDHERARRERAEPLEEAGGGARDGGRDRDLGQAFRVGTQVPLDRAREHRREQEGDAVHGERRGRRPEDQQDPAERRPECVAEVRHRRRQGVHGRQIVLADDPWDRRVHAGAVGDRERGRDPREHDRGQWGAVARHDDRQGEHDRRTDQVRLDHRRPPRPSVGDHPPDRAEHHVREQAHDPRGRDPAGRPRSFEDEHDEGDVVEPVADLRQAHAADEQADVPIAERHPELPLHRLPPSVPRADPRHAPDPLGL